MTNSERTEFHSMMQRFDDAASRDDADAMREIVNDDRFRTLVTQFSFQDAGEFIDGLKSKNLTMQAMLGIAKADTLRAVSVSRVHRASIKQLEKRVEALESKGVDFKYLGVWRHGIEYAAGSMATHSGSLWHANIKTMSAPGTDATWTLAVKRGAFQ